MEGKLCLYTKRELRNQHCKNQNGRERQGISFFHRWTQDIEEERAVAWHTQIHLYPQSNGLEAEHGDELYFVDNARNLQNK